MPKRSFPHPLIILLCFVLLAGIAAYLIPSGSFERQTDATTGREVVIPGSFHPVADRNLSVYEIALSVPEGLILGADILVLILLIGGAFYVIEKTGALQVGIESLIFRFRNTQILLLFLIAVVFAICGATIAMQEEIIALVPILILLAKKLRYDLRSIIALALGSALVGGSFSPINPFGSLLAQKLANVDFMEGLLYRVFFFVLAIGCWTAFHVHFGKSQDAARDKEEFLAVKISLRHTIILVLMFSGILVMGWGITQRDWGYNEMSALFFVVGLVCGMVGNLGVNGTARAYAEGFGEMIFAGVIVGLARSVFIILENSSVIDPIIQALFEPLETLPTALAAIGIAVSQSIIHIPVPSTSGQAVLTIPLASPLADLLGVSRQVAVLSYQYSAGLMDLITPTNGGMMAVIAAAGVKYDDWISYIWKSWLMLMLLGLISVLIALFWFS